MINMHKEKGVTKNEMIFFQNDILTDIKKMEIQTNNKITNINQTLLSKINEYDTKFSKVFENITELVSIVSSRKFDNERIEDLLSMKDKFSDQIYQNQSHLSTLEKSLENSIYRYDRAILDNLQVPGIIGVSCKYKNCRMFFEEMYEELKTIKKFKEEEKAAMKSFQDKIDTRLFKVENELNKIHLNVNEIVQTKCERFFKKMEQRIESTDSFVHASRIENSKYASDLIKTSTSLQIQWDKLENIKNEIYDKFYEELDKFKKLVDSTNRVFHHQESEYNIIKQRFTQLAEYIKDLKNMKNKDFIEISKNIDFSRKQKFDENYDMTKYDKISGEMNNFLKSPSPKKVKRNNEINTTTRIQARRESYISNKSNKNVMKMATKAPRRNSMFNTTNPDEMIKKIETISKKQEIKESDEKSKDNNEDIKGGTMVNFINKNKNISAKALNIIGEEIEKKKEPKNITYKKNNYTKKTMVTENKIDLNFESKKKIKFDLNKNKKLNKANEGEDEDGEEISEPSSSSSELSFSSADISLNKLNEQKKEKLKNNKDDKSIKEKEIIIIKDNSVKIKGESQKLNTETKIINLKETLNNDKYLKMDKKDKSNNLPKIINSIGNIKVNEIKDEKSENETKKNNLIENKNNSNLNNNLQNNINTQNSYINNNSPKNISEMKLNLNDNKENKPIIHLKLNDDDKAIKDIYNISLLDKKKRIQQLQITEYKDKNNLTKKDSRLKINPEIAFPQIKTMPNEFKRKDNYKLTENNIQKTFPTNINTESSEIARNARNVSHRFNSNRLNFSSLIYQEKINNSKYIQNNTEKIKRISNTNINKSIDNNEKKENKENKENEENEKNEKNEKNKEKDKSNNLCDSLESSKNQIRKIINSNYNDISNNNAFLTSLNNISNSYNYYYNNNNLNENSKLINILNDKSKKSEEKINKFTSMIDVVNVNINTINSKINILEVRYQALLKQVNKIYKIVLTHYRNHKRKSTRRNNNKEKSNDEKSKEKEKEKDDSNKNQNFMRKLKELYDDNDYNIKIVDAQYNSTLKKIEPFLIKKFKNNQK